MLIIKKDSTTIVHEFLKGNAVLYNGIINDMNGKWILLGDDLELKESYNKFKDEYSKNAAAIINSRIDNNKKQENPQLQTLASAFK